MKKLKYILLGVLVLVAAQVLAINITIPQATGYGVIPRGNANGTYTPVATSTLFGYTPLSSVSISSANGFAGSSSGGATPALTLSTSITGMLKGNGTAISAASNGTDYTLITAKTCTAGDFVSQVTAGGVFTCTTPSGTTYTATYPVTLTGSAFGLAFGTTTSNTWAGTQAFTNTVNFNTWTNNGSATTTNLAITGLTGLLVGNGSTKPISIAVSGTDLKTVNSTSIIGSGDIAVQPTLVSGTNIKTINGSSILGSGDLTVTGGNGLASSTPWTFGSLVVAKDNGSVTTIATSTIKTSQLTNDAGFITSAVTSVTGTFPIISSGGATPNITFSGLSTSSAPTIGQMPYWTGVNTFGSVATTTATCAGTVSCTTFTILGSTPITLTGSGGGTSAYEIATTSTITVPQLAYFTNASGRTTLGGVATSSLTATSPLALSQPISVIGPLASALTCTTASSGVGGCLSNTMYDTFNNKVSTARTINTTYPILGGGDLSADRTFSLAFGTTTDNVWSGKNTFTGNASTTLLSAANLFVNAIQATSTTQNSVFLNNYIGFGTTTPKYNVQISSSTAPQLTLTGTNTDPGISLRSVGGHLYVASTSPTTYATSTTPAIDINTSAGTSPGLAIATTSQTRILNLGSDPSTTAASTTIRMQKLQFEGLNSAGTMSCTYLVGTSWVVQAGTCN